MAITSELDYTHTSVQRIEDLYGTRGYDGILDGFASGADRDRYLGDLIDTATQTVDFYLWERYDPADYTTVPWVIDRCTWIAAYLHSRRKGNPGEFLDLREDALEELKAVKEGMFSLPNVPLRDNNLPSMSNVTVDGWHRRARLRVDPVTSVGETYSNQHIQYTSWFEWL